MISNVITYLFIGVVFNFLFDKLVDFSESEDHRFNMGERIAMTLLWPIGVLTLVYYFIKNLVD